MTAETGQLDGPFQVSQMPWPRQMAVSCSALQQGPSHLDAPYFHRKVSQRAKLVPEQGRGRDSSESGELSRSPRPPPEVATYCSRLEGTPGAAQEGG